MKLRNMLLASSAAFLCAASLSATTIEHTWVSRSGNDNNTCTSTTPCLTFQGALANTAAGGIITAEDAGDFGPVTIGQSVTIDGNNLGSITFNNAGLADGIYIYSTANVTLQNLTINGLGSGASGIYDTKGGILIVDNCRIMNVTVLGIDFQGAGTLTVENSRIEDLIGSGVDGIFISSNDAKNVVVKNTVIDASPANANNTGFNINSGTGPVTASLQNVTILGAGNGAVKTLSGLTHIIGSVLTQGSTAVEASNGATISVASSLVTDFTNGICSDSSSKIRLDNNDIYDNTYAIANCGGIVKTSTTNKTSGTIAIPAADVSDSITF